MADADSHLARIRRWWRTLGGEGFVVLPPPTRERYTQSDGHDDATELLAQRGLPADTSFAYWHWQSQERFSADGMLEMPLLLHWGGDHQTVRAGLGAGPEGFAIMDNGPGGAFALDLVTTTDADGLPDPADPVAARKLYDQLKDDSPLTTAQEAWLHARLAEALAAGEPAAVLEAAEAPLIALARHAAVSPPEAEQLIGPWEKVHGEDLGSWGGGRVLILSLLRTGHPRAIELARRSGPRAAGALAQVPSPHTLEAVREMVAEGADAGHWLHLHAAVHEVLPAQAAAQIGPGIDPEDARVWDELRMGLQREEDIRGPRASLRIALDESLPRPLRASAARLALRSLEDVREELDPADLARAEAELPGLLAGTGPDLTGYEGALTWHWHEYRTLTADDEAWLHARIAEPDAQIQAVALCLELLVAHGAGTVADLDALRRRWRKLLAKTYRTTYTEWRHPMVTLTCLAHDLADPLTEQLDAWWEKRPPAWKGQIAPLTLLGGEPSEEKAAQLEQLIAEGVHDQGHLLTLLLLRARLEGVRPLDVADALLVRGTIPPHRMATALLGCVDPAQPLWHYAVDPSSVSWWDRIVEVAEDPTLSPQARALALEEARSHRVITHPQHAHGFSRTATARAQAWLAARPGA